MFQTSSDQIIKILRSYATQTDRVALVIAAVTPEGDYRIVHADTMLGQWQYLPEDVLRKDYFTPMVTSVLQGRTRAMPKTDPRRKAVDLALERAGVPLESLDPTFVAYWLDQNKTPEQIVSIATNHAICPRCGAINTHVEGCDMERLWAV